MSLWERFRDTVLIRDGAGFRIMGAFDAHLDRRVTVVMPSRDPDEPSTRSALARLFEAHTAAAHPATARSIEFGVMGGTPFVVFDLPVHCDLDGLVQASVATGIRASHAEADGFIACLRDALLLDGNRIANAGLPGPNLGALGFGNVLFSADGTFQLLGFGHNVALFAPTGRLEPTTRWFHAPEVAVGAPPSPSSDFVALLGMLRGLMAFVDVDSSIARCIAGNSVAQDVELARRILWIERNVIHADPSRRASIRQTIRVSDRIRELIGVWPDADAFRCRVTQVLGMTTARRQERPVLAVAEDGTWFQREGHPRVDLSSRRVLTRLLGRIADQRTLRPGVEVPAAELLAVGWPGDRGHISSANNRLYVSINALRRAGLGSDLARSDGGYLIPASTPLRRSELPSEGR